jgi:hypothetical protein
MNPLIYTEINSDFIGDSEYTTITNQSELTNLLSKTTIKRGCCLNKNSSGPITVKVKIPIPKDYAVDKGSDNEKYNFIEKIVEFDKSLCDSKYTNGSSVCDDFYRAYCSEANREYIKLSGKSYNLSDWAKYAPDCACFGSLESGKITNTIPLANSGLNIPGKCYRPGCGTSVSYIDSVSRSNECNITSCTALFSAQDIIAGRDAGISSTIVQNCGEVPPKSGNGGDSGNGEDNVDNGNGGDSGNGEDNVDNGNGGDSGNGGDNGNGDNENGRDTGDTGNTGDLFDESSFSVIVSKFQYLDVLLLLLLFGVTCTITFGLTR